MTQSRRVDGESYTPWTLTEHDLVMQEFDGHRATAEALAELLDRTVKAVEAHFYGFRAGRVKKPLTDSKPLMESYRAQAAYRTAESLELTRPVCETHFVELTASGECPFEQ